MCYFVHVVTFINLLQRIPSEFILILFISDFFDLEIKQTNHTLQTGITSSASLYLNNILSLFIFKTIHCNALLLVLLCKIRHL